MPDPIQQERTRILVTGGTGQVGSELVRLLNRSAEVHAPGRAELDLANPAAIRDVVRRVRPRWIVNAGAYTAVDHAETNRDQAFAVNAAAAGILGEEAVGVGAAVLHFSTDYVYGGGGTDPYVEENPTGPLGVYGASKLEGEQLLARSGAPYVTFRTSWVFGATGKNFLNTVLRVARERSEMKIVDDQFGAPTSSRDLAEVAATVLRQCDPDGESLNHLNTVRQLQGVYHVANAGETTWFRFAEEALRLRSLQEPEVKFAKLLPIATSSYPTPARRPLNSRLSCVKLGRTFGIRLRPWQTALADVLREIPVA